MVTIPLRMKNPTPFSISFSVLQKKVQLSAGVVPLWSHLTCTPTKSNSCFTNSFTTVFHKPDIERSNSHTSFLVVTIPKCSFKFEALSKNSWHAFFKSLSVAGHPYWRTPTVSHLQQLICIFAGTFHMLTVSPPSTIWGCATTIVKLTPRLYSPLIALATSLQMPITTEIHFHKYVNVTGQTKLLL